MGGSSYYQSPTKFDTNITLAYNSNEVKLVSGSEVKFAGGNKIAYPNSTVTVDFTGTDYTNWKNIMKFISENTGQNTISGSLTIKGGKTPFRPNSGYDGETSFSGTGRFEYNHDSDTFTFTPPSFGSLNMAGNNTSTITFGITGISID